MRVLCFAPVVLLALVPDCSLAHAGEEGCACAALDGARWVAFVL
jgi:hypothetical protein